MNTKKRTTCAKRRILAGGLALLTAGAAVLPAGAAGPAPTSDETYYATLDYYGGLMDSSVVKSIRTFGNPSISDYGVYDEVINLTDSRSGTLTADGVSFDLTGDVPDKFYFEGKTSQPYAQFPWSISLSYTLNGLPARAEELAGQKGVVEITLDALPKPTASEYSRNNLVLVATSMFNGDDILSLEAPGAQVQLIGNLYTVLYAVLPGEEQHFTIRVGTDSFTYSGMIFLAVPATLDQLSQVADLREAKEEAEDSYHAMLDSMHAILDSMEGMSGSLNTAANGLDQLNRARGIISGGKGGVYDSVDEALEAGTALADSLKPLADLQPEPPEPEPAEDIPLFIPGTLGQIFTADGGIWTGPKLLEPKQPAGSGEAGGTEAVPDAGPAPEPADTAAESAAPGDAGEVPGEPAGVEEVPLVMVGHLATAKNALTDTNKLLNEMSGNIVSLRTEVEQTRKILKQVQDDLKELKSSSRDLNRISRQLSRDLEDLRRSSDRLGSALGSTRTISSVPSITVNGMSVGQLNSLVTSAKDGYSQYMQATQGTGNLAGYQGYLQSIGKTESEAQQAAQMASGAYDEKLNQANMADSAIGGVNDKISEVNSLVSGIAGPAGTTMHDVADLTSTLERLARLVEDLSDGETITPIGNAQDMVDMAMDLTEKADLSLNQLEALTGIMNLYDPDLQQALSDTQVTVVSATNSLSTLIAASTAAKDLLQQSGPSLDRGTQQTLSGVAAALRKSTAGLDQTHTVREALDTIDALISDQWDSHTGEDNNILLMDASAAPQSLTDSRNQRVGSIQYVMRTQEITVDDAKDDAPPAAEQEDNGTVWSRIAAMFRDIWAAICGIFS